MFTKPSEAAFEVDALLLDDSLFEDRVVGGVVGDEHAGGVTEVAAGQAIVTEPGEWVRYSTPAEGGAEYIAVCLPAFSLATVHRDAG